MPLDTYWSSNRQPINFIVYQPKISREKSIQLRLAILFAFNGYLPWPTRTTVTQKICYRLLLTKILVSDTQLFHNFEIFKNTNVSPLVASESSNYVTLMVLMSTQMPYFAWVRVWVSDASMCLKCLILHKSNFRLWGLN